MTGNGDKIQRLKDKESGNFRFKSKQQHSHLALDKLYLNIRVLERRFHFIGLVEGVPSHAWQGGWNKMILKVPYNPNHSVIL